MKYFRKKSEISGTYWIEFNFSGSEGAFVHWHENSMFLNPDSLFEITHKFEGTLDKFTHYGPNFFTTHKVHQLSIAFEKDQKNILLENEVLAILENCSKNKTPLWILGV